MIGEIVERLKNKGRTGVNFEQQKVLIFALGRSGSTLLEDLLRSTGHFQAHGELFRPSEPIQKDPLNYFIEKAMECRGKHFISHIKVYQMESVVQSALSKREFLEGLLENGWKIIYLVRSNKLKHTFSSYRAQESSIFHTEVKLPPFRTTIDCYRFGYSVAQMIEWGEEEKELLQNLPFYELSYEAHLESEEEHQATVDSILDYLQLPRRKAFTTNKKVIDEALETIIVNYDEFAKEMQTKGYGRFL